MLDRVFHAYADLNELVNFNRKKFRLIRSGSMLERNTFDFDQRVAMLKQKQNSVTLSRSQTRLLASHQFGETNNLTTNSDDGRAAKDRKTYKRKKTELMEESLLERPTTTGDFKRSLMKNFGKHKSRIRQPKSNISSSSSINKSPNQSKVMKKVDMRRFLYLKGKSNQEDNKAKFSLSQRRNQNIRIKTGRPSTSDIECLQSPVIATPLRFKKDTASFMDTQLDLDSNQQLATFPDPKDPDGSFKIESQGA